MGRVGKALASVDFIPVDGRGGTMDLTIGGHATTGDFVGADAALSLSAFWRGMRLLSDSVAMLPLITYAELEGGDKRRARDHHLYHVLRKRPNPEMTSFTWRQVTMSHVIAWGNGYSEKVFDGTGRVRGLWVLRPDRMVVERDDRTLERRYRYRRLDGTEVILPQRRVHHIKGLGFDGLVGYPLLTLMRNSLYVAREAQRAQAHLFKNGARPAVVLAHPEKLADNAKTNLADSFEENHAGTENAGRTAVLDEGVKLYQIGFPPADAQFLQTREFEVTEFARWIGLPPHKLYDLKRATFSNIEQQAFEYLMDSLNPWLVNWEQQMLLDLFDPTDEAYPEFERNALMQVDARSRALFYQTMRWLGVYNADDIARLEGHNALPRGIGQTHFVPMNMTPLEQARSLTPSERRQAHQALLASGVDREAADAMTMAHLLDADDRLAAIAHSSASNGSHP